MQQNSQIHINTAADPLIPFKAGFDQALEQLASTESQTVIFQTRSPLVVILVPAFRKIQERLTVVIPIEALNDALHQQLEERLGNPGLPLPSERLSAARTLRELGFNVEIKLRPYAGEHFISRSLPRRALEVFARICDQSATTVTLEEPLDGSSRTKAIFNQILAHHLHQSRLRLESDPGQAAA